MARRPIPHRSLPLCLTLLAACASPDARGDASGSGSEAEADGGTEPLPEGFCQETCAQQHPDICFGDSCEEYCEASSTDWDISIGEAFRFCVQDEPWCDIGGFGICTFVGRFGGEEVPIKVYEAVEPFNTDGGTYNGMDVYAWTDLTGEFGPATVQDGALDLETAMVVPEEIPDAHRVFVHTYVDVNGNGRCDEDVDMGTTEHVSWNLSFSEPAYEFELGFTFSSPASCFVFES